MVNCSQFQATNIIQMHTSKSFLQKNRIFSFPEFSRRIIAVRTHLFLINSRHEYLEMVASILFKMIKLTWI
ncbi:MAG: hypothetical protein DRI89_04780 [Bacteroidetes bacterium]|nr:MAG: hypothetical protein DRI89_04780 [Bacteroidota bacterium]